jgi:hypothetical protein
MFVFEPPQQRRPSRKPAWLWVAGLLLIPVGCLLGGNLVISEPLGGSTGAENARDEVLDREAPQVVRDLEVANPDPGQDSVAWLTSHFQTTGDTVLRSSSSQGEPSSGSLDVRMIRAATGDALGQPTESETIAICLRFETGWSETWSQTSGVRTTFREIDCP